MSVQRVVCSLSREPKIRLVEEPRLPTALARELARERRALEEHADHFDGPQLMLLEASAFEVVGYQGSYAHYRAVQRLGPKTALGLGTAGVGLVLTDARGRELWTRRSQQVDHPGSWCYALGGGVERAQGGFRGAVLSELEEELGLSERDLYRLTPCVLLADDSGDGGYLVYSARLRAESAIRLNEDEVTEARWVQDPLLELDVQPHFVDLYLTAKPYLPR